MFQGEAIRLSVLGDGLLEMAFDRQGSQVNVLDGRALQEWREVNAWLATQTGIRGLLVSSAKDVFIVGADIGEFAAIFSLSDEALVSRTLDANSILNAFEDLPFPTVAAINGYALGGGLEMALSADARVMSETARIGLPEISLGIYPAYGGTVRLARLAPLGQALDWVLNAGMHTAREALDAGVVDAVAAPAQLRDEALHWLRKLASDPPDPPQRRLQNSNTCRSRSGLGHAHDWQSKPSSWLTASSAGTPRFTPIAATSEEVTPTALSPAAAALGGARRAGVSSQGGCAAGSVGGWDMPRSWGFAPPGQLRGGPAPPTGRATARPALGTRKYRADRAVADPPDHRAPTARSRELIGLQQVHRAVEEKHAGLARTFGIRRGKSHIPPHAPVMERQCDLIAVALPAAFPRPPIRARRGHRPLAVGPHRSTGLPGERAILPERERRGPDRPARARGNRTAALESAGHPGPVRSADRREDAHVPHERIACLVGLKRRGRHLPVAPLHGELVRLDAPGPMALGAPHQRLPGKIPRR